VKHILLLGIQAYWAFWPRRWKRTCLYRETCSRFVYRTTQEDGCIAGLRALTCRYFTCRPQYSIEVEEGRFFVRLSDGSQLQAEVMSPVLFRSLHQPVA
jgi:uncharacterized protein